MSAEQPTRDDERDGSLSAHERTERSSEGTSAVSRHDELRQYLVGEGAFSLLDFSPCGHTVLALDGTIVYANRAFLRMSGRDENAISGLQFQNLLPPGGMIFYETQFAPSLMVRRSLEEISFDLIHPDGERHPVLVNAVLSPPTDRLGSYILIAAFGARQRRLYEAELLRARREFEQVEEVVRQSSDGIIKLSADSIIESWNRGAQQIFGLTGTEAIGKPYHSLFLDESKELMSECARQLKQGLESSIELQAMRNDERLVDVSVTLTPHMEAPGTLVGFSAVIRDITTRKRTEKALLQSEKLASVGRLASSIAHEINNPLEAVTNLLYLLELDTTDPGAKVLVKSAQEELARVSHIATHTLRFHKQSSARTLVDIQTLFDSVLSLYKARLQNSHITTVIDLSEPCVLFCYEGELRQILVNLVANAFDAMRMGGTLILRSRQTRTQIGNLPAIRITVADSGTGIDAPTARRLFEPFLTTKGIGGTGLGLWISKDLIEKNDGAIRIRTTTRPGRSGTTVSMLFSNQTSR